MQFTTPAAAVVDTPGPNVATEATVTDVSSEFSEGFAADNAIDGDPSTEWSGADGLSIGEFRATGEVIRLVTDRGVVGDFGVHGRDSTNRYLVSACARWALDACRSDGRRGRRSERQTPHCRASR